MLSYHRNVGRSPRARTETPVVVAFFLSQSTAFIYPMTCFSACHQIVPSVKKERKRKTFTNNEKQKYNIHVYFTAKTMQWGYKMFQEKTEVISLNDGR